MADVAAQLRQRNEDLARIGDGVGRGRRGVNGSAAPSAPRSSHSASARPRRGRPCARASGSSRSHCRGLRHGSRFIACVPFSGLTARSAARRRALSHACADLASRADRPAGRCRGPGRQAPTRWRRCAAPRPAQVPRSCLARSMGLDVWPRQHQARSCLRRRARRDASLRARPPRADHAGLVASSCDLGRRHQGHVGGQDEAPASAASRCAQAGAQAPFRLSAASGTTSHRAPREAPPPPRPA